MTLLIGALVIGLILSLLAMGVYISFRIYSFPDITAEGSFTFGAAVTAAMIVSGSNPWTATLAGFLAGMIAGATTGLLHTKFGINGLLAGILVMTSLYSINLRVMQKSNIPLLDQTSLFTYVEQATRMVAGDSNLIDLFGWPVRATELGSLLAAFLFISLLAALLYWFFRTEYGTTMRATGDNAQMIRALGVNVDTRLIFGLALSNGMVALAGSLLAQYQGFADVQMGIGMLVLGLASVIIGEALVGTKSLGLLIIGTVMGSLLFRLLVAIALRWGLNPNDLKLITAIFVLVALIAPGYLRKLQHGKGGVHVRS